MNQISVNKFSIFNFDSQSSVQKRGLIAETIFVNHNYENNKILTEQKEKSLLSTNLYYASKQKQNKIKGYWTTEQKRVYLNFLIQNKSYFKDKEVRRKFRIFKRLANQIKSRDSDQCRRHHQEYQTKIGNKINDIIQFLSSKLKREYLIIQQSKQIKESITIKSQIINQNEEIIFSKQNFGRYIIERSTNNMLKVTLADQDIQDWFFDL